MCWSASVSLNTFIFSLFGTLFALFNGVIDVPQALFFTSFTSMQLVEYFAWKDLSDTRIPSMVGLLLLFLQIVLVIYNYYKGPYQNLLYGFWFAIIAVILMTTKIDLSMHKAPNGHLTWNWLNSIPKIYWLIFVLFYLGIGIDYKYNLVFLAFLAVISFSWYNYSASGTFGSMWCWISNAFALVWIFRVFRKELC